MYWEVNRLAIILPDLGGMNEDKYLRHALNAPKRPKDFAHSVGNVKEVIEHPICNRCERVALRHQGWRDSRRYRCPHCGDEGYAEKLLRGYLKEKLYRG